MILPDKMLKLRFSLLGAATLVLTELERPQTVSFLWEKVKHHAEVGAFGKFVLLLDFLYALGLVEYDTGLLRRRSVANDSESV